MSLIDKKQGILNTINSYVSFLQQPEDNNFELNSLISNKNDSISFIIDILKSVAGVDGLKETMGGLFTDVLDNSEEKIKIALKKHSTQLNFDQLIPNTLITDGISIPIKSFDLKGKYKLNPNSDSGKLIYETTDINVENFDNCVYKAIQTPNVDSIVNSIGVKFNFNDTTETINIKILQSDNLKVGDFFTNYIENIKIFNKNEITTNLIDSVYGTFSNKNKRSINEIILNKKIEKIFDKVAEEDYGFTLTNQELNDVLSKSNDLFHGIRKYNVGCDIVEDLISFNDLTTLVNTVTGTNDKTIISNGFTNCIGRGNNVINNNKNSVHDNFLTTLIKLLKNILIETVMILPPTKVILIFIGFLSNGEFVDIDDTLNYLSTMKNFIVCLLEDIIDLIAEYIFNLAISYILKLMIPIIKKFIEEKISNYSNQMLSLVGAGELSQLINNGI